MPKKISELTAGFIEILEEISHDPDEFDDYDLTEYIENLPNPYKVLKEFALYVHEYHL
jgi:hypothetical protein